MKYEIGDRVEIKEEVLYHGRYTNFALNFLEKNNFILTIKEVGKYYIIAEETEILEWTTDQIKCIVYDPSEIIYDRFEILDL